MIRTGESYRAALRDDRAVYVNGDRVKDVTCHPVFRPMVDLRAHVFDMAHEPAFSSVMTQRGPKGPVPVANALPFSQADWWAKRRAADLVMDQLGAPVTRIGDETVGEIWSLQDAAEALAEIDPTYAPNIRLHIDRIVQGDLFHVSANADPRPLIGQPKGSDMALRVVRETDAGLILRGAKFETAAAYAEQAFTKPTIADWGDAETSDRAVGFICDLSSPGLRFICRTGFANRAPAEDAPLSSRFDEIDTLLIFDDVLVPWENVLFYRHTRAAMQMRATLHRYTAFAFVQRLQKQADLLIGAALMNLRQTGLDQLPAVQDKLAELAVYREGINAHLTAAIALAERSPAGLMMPNQSLLYAGRVLACSQLPQMLHLARELCGGQVALTPDAASFRAEETGPWLERCYGGTAELAEDRRRLMAFARDLLNSDHAGQRLSFQLFAQSPPFAHLAAVYHNFDWEGPLSLLRHAAELSAPTKTPATPADPRTRWFSTETSRPFAAH